jgi:hypothetical protein
MSGVGRERVSLNDAEQKVYELLREACDNDLRRMAKLLADKDDSNLFGQTEFDLRDRVHALGARALEAVADERQKKGGVRTS